MAATLRRTDAVSSLFEVQIEAAGQVDLSFLTRTGRSELAYPRGTREMGHAEWVPP
jgi:hypothetical protein